ncbi:MAG: hypothetical protein A2Z04_04375 [Chloroflexi bacterium RBG_16_57_9]|nr:MAG: hypothetical protein A2Z04_04375 [Chloroflexi bacterium RBG_16_57_9]
MVKTYDLLTLCAYNYWANARILDTAAKISAAQFTAPAMFSPGSLRGTLAHTLSAEWIWRMRIQEGISPTAMLHEEDFPTLEAIRARWREEEQVMLGFLASLPDEDLERVVRYTSTGGVPYENQRWHLLMHLLNHGTQHRSEAAAMLTDYGQSPGDIDFIVFLRERGV